jgi:hypothetical protein
MSVTFKPLLPDLPATPYQAHSHWFGVLNASLRVFRDQSAAHPARLAARGAAEDAARQCLYNIASCMASQGISPRQGTYLLARLERIAGDLLG